MPTIETTMVAQLATPQNCPICVLPSPIPPATVSCTSFPGQLSTYVILVGDPGINLGSPGHNHDVGSLFNLSAQTQANSLQSQGYNVIACRVSSVQDVYNALTKNGNIGGGVYYFGHSGVYQEIQGGTIQVQTTNLFVGQDKGQYTNVNASDVGFLNPIHTANSGQNFLGNNAALTINGCQAGLQIYDTTYAGYTSIAQLISNNIWRGVYAYAVGTYFSQNDSKHDKFVNGFGHTMQEALPMYMVPEGVPGNKSNLLGFTPH